MRVRKKTKKTIIEKQKCRSIQRKKQEYTETERKEKRLEKD